MKQEERNRLKRAAILDAALREFGEKSYAEASVNAICAEGNISKGILYHYYADKDAIYLACIESCFQVMMDYFIENIPPLTGEIEVDLSAYFNCRLGFLQKNPIYQNVFYQVMLYTPHELREAISSIRQAFDQFNLNIIHNALKDTKLRQGLTFDDVRALYTFYLSYANSTEQMRCAISQGPESREALCRQWIRIFLYGIVIE